MLETLLAVYFNTFNEYEIFCIMKFIYKIHIN